MVCEGFLSTALTPASRVWEPPMGPYSQCWGVKHSTGWLVASTVLVADRRLFVFGWWPSKIGPDRHRGWRLDEAPLTFSQTGLEVEQSLNCLGYRLVLNSGLFDRPRPSRHD